MTDLDSQIENLKECMKDVNTSYAKIDDWLKYKWNEIKNLDIKEKDLNRIKNMGDLPDQFKESFAKYEKSRNIEDIETPIK